MIRSAYTDRTYVDKEFTEKVKALLRTQTTTPNLELPGVIHQLGPAELAALRQNDTSDTTKVLNLKKILGATVAQEGSSKPFLLAIGERAQALAAAYEDRQLTTQQALIEFEKLAEQAIAAEAQRQNLKVDENTFAIYIALQPLVPALNPSQAQEINALFLSHPDYAWNEHQKGQLRTQLYKALRLLVQPNQLIETANNLLKLHRV